jgi:phosphoglucosamine mutase
VTTMANLGFHRLMEERGVRVVVTDVGDRYVLEALRREGLLLGGEQSGHLIWLDGHVTGDGLVAGLLLCRALRGRSLSEAVAAMPRFPQVTQNIPRTERGPLPAELLAAVESVNAELDGAGRVLVRPSGTEPVIRLLAEAETQAAAEELCARIAALVTHELG